MTLASLPSPILWPGIINGFAGATPGFFTTATVSAAGHYVSYILSAKEDMTISHVGFRAGTATGSPTIEVRIETVDASGLPSGTLWATNTNGTTGTVSSNTNPLQALTASASVTKGQVFCVKIAYASGTSQVIQHSPSNISVAGSNNLPYKVINTGSPTKSAVTECPTLALGSSSTTFYQLPGFLPISASGYNAFNNTNSAKRGLRFTPPMKCRVIGIRFASNNNVGDFNAAIFDDAGSELSTSSTAFDGDHSAANTQGVTVVFFDNPVTLTAGNTYRASIEPSTTTNVNIGTFTLPSSSYRGASPAGTTAHYTTFASGSWTDTATDQLPMLDILIDQLDDGAGGGNTVIGVIGS